MFLTPLDKRHRLSPGSPRPECSIVFQPHPEVPHIQSDTRTRSHWPTDQIAEKSGVLEKILTDFEDILAVTIMGLYLVQNKFLAFAPCLFYRYKISNPPKTLQKESCFRNRVFWSQSFESPPHTIYFFSCCGLLFKCYKL